MTHRRLGLVAAVGLSLASVAACKGNPPELDPAPQKDPSAPTTPTPTATTTAATTRAADLNMAPAARGGGDPMNGTFSLADATKDLKGAGAIVAKIDSSKGVIQCKLYDDKAPLTVANFIGLATGKRTWKDPNGQWVNKPAYDGTTFHRVIKGFMIQGGDAAGTGSGEPGYTVKDEKWDGANHNKPGLLCMANRGKDTNGAQFFITDAPSPNLDTMPTAYTVFGECAPLEVVHDIANVQTGPRDKPDTAVTIKSITISRDEKKK